MAGPRGILCHGEPGYFPRSEFIDTPLGRVHNTEIPHYQQTGLPIGRVPPDSVEWGSSSWDDVPEAALPGESQHDPGIN
jgi:hypothetical protein